MFAPAVCGHGDRAEATSEFAVIADPAITVHSSALLLVAVRRGTGPHRFVGLQ